MSEMSTPFVSVIIPVYNDAERLKKCLQVLEEQTYPKSAYEVIVVDNGSDESIEPVVAEFSQAKASLETRPGSYVARNKGLSLAQGEIMAFIDSDCIPASDWIERGVVNLLRMSDDGIVGGSVEFLFKDPNHPTAVELYDSMMHFNMKNYIEKRNFCGAGNLFTFRRVFGYVGHFDEHLKSGGDLEWGHRATSLGYKLLYAEDVRVAHPARDSFKQLCQRIRRIERGFKGEKRTNSLFPLTWSYESIIEHLPPLPPVIKTVRLRGVSLKTRIKIIILGGIISYITIEESVRRKLKLQRKSLR